MSHLTIILLSTLLSILPVNLAQDPVPTPIPTPEGGSCNLIVYLHSQPREGDMLVAGGLDEPAFTVPIYALTCLPQDSDCQTTGEILGYTVIYACSKGGVCFNMPLIRPLRHSEYIALYARAGYECLWKVYRVLPWSVYLPLVLQ